VSRLLKHPLAPLLILLTVNLTVGLLTFRDFGLSWDEPLFYNYADSIWKAYTPQAFAPGFDFEQVYGRSAEDHKFYGPAYILFARPVEQGLETVFHLDLASAWHLVNFLTFQLGLMAFYRLVRRWCDPWPAAMTTAFLAWQPVFWGHAFINPKDMPFMVFFLWALTLGLEMVDTLTNPSPNMPAKRGEVARKVLLAGLMLGLTAAIRVIGPLVGAILFLYFVSKLPRRGWIAFGLYGLLAMLVMFVFWPYLWADPVKRLLEVLKHMSNNPTELAVLFDGQIFRANAMPRRYLPQMLALALTEPTWILFLSGLLLATRNLIQKKLDFRAPLAVLTVFVFMLAYLLYNVPAMYDGFRHFLFILPPVIVFCGFAFQWLWELRGNPGSQKTAALTGFWRQAGKEIPSLAMILMLLPGLSGMLQLHPYEYAYYNRFAGGVGGAYRVYETEYWLTCYKEALQWVKTNEPATTLHVQREMGLAAAYGQGLNLKDLSQENEVNIQTGDLLLFHTRANLDTRSIYRKLPAVATFGRGGAQFCILKRKD
jgi:hypothetical protein